MKEQELGWARWPWQQCRAVREPRQDSNIWGRCELRRGHPIEVDHALERGFDTPRWSTDWTEDPQVKAWMENHRLDK